MLPVLAFSIASAVRDYDQRRDELRESLLVSVEVISAEVERLFDSSDKVLRIAREQQAVRENFQPACTDFLANILAGIPTFFNIASFNHEGDLLCSARPVFEGLNYHEAEWFKDTLTADSMIVGGPVASRLDGTSVLVVSMPLDADDRAGTGVIAASFQTNFMNRALLYGNLAPDTALFLIDEHGRSLLPGGDSTVLPPPEHLRPLIAGQRTVVEADARNGAGAYLYASVRLGESGIYALLARPSLATSLPLFWELALDVALPVLLTAITLLIVWFATERMSLRWVRHLRAVAIAHRRGMTGVRAREYESAPIEYRELGDALNSMAAAIEARQTRLLENLHERETLLREIHHRVKNNLQIIISLFNLYARNAQSDVETLHLREMQARVESLALVHHAAYQSDDLQHIPMAEFLPALMGHMERVLDDRDWSFTTSCEVDDVFLTMDQAVPLAQLVVEVVSSIRMYHPGPVTGSIAVALRRVDGDAVMLTIDTDLPETDTVPETHRAQLSRSLMTAFAKQLGGTLEMDDAMSHLSVRISNFRDA